MTGIGNLILESLESAGVGTLLLRTGSGDCTFDTLTTLGDGDISPRVGTGVGVLNSSFSVGQGSLFSRADTLREYYTGAASDGDTQNDPALCLGGFKSTKEAASVGFIFDTSNNPGVVLEYGSGSLPTGLSRIQVIDQFTLALIPYGTETPGPSVSIPIQATALLEASGHPEQYIRVRAYPPFDLRDCGVHISSLFNEVFGFGNVSSAEATSGAAHYRGTILQNPNNGTVKNVSRWIGTLGTPQISDVAWLGSSGSGTLETSDGFDDWPLSGWCRIENNTGDLIETVYYSSRTSTVLTVPSNGRGRLGSSATVGWEDNVLQSVPGIAIALDTNGVVSAGSSMETIANITTAPAGVTWVNGTNSAHGLAIGDLLTGEQVGIWMWRDTPPGCKGTPSHTIKLRTRFTTPYDTTVEQTGQYRVAEAALEGYYVYVGEDELPDLTGTETAYSATLPITISHSRPGSGVQVLYIITRYRNAYGLFSQNQNPRVIKLSSSAEIMPPIPAPLAVKAYARSTGQMRILLRYPTIALDIYPADKVKIWIGATLPDTGVDAPVVFDTIIDEYAAYIAESYTPGTYYVVVGLYRSADSTLSEVVTLNVVFPDLPEDPEAVFTEYVED